MSAEAGEAPELPVSLGMPVISDNGLKKALVSRATEIAGRQRKRRNGAIDLSRISGNVWN